MAYVDSVFGNYGDIPMDQIDIDPKRLKKTQLLFHFMSVTEKTATHP